MNERHVCIYCGQVAASREHWLPRALGSIKGMHLLKERLCGDCNALLGRELDEELARTGPTGLYRATYGIKGRRSHSEVNLFHYRALSHLQPTSLKRSAPHGQWEILGESYISHEGRPCSRTLRQVVVKDANGVISPLPFPRAWSAEMVTRMLQERGLQGAELLELYLDEDEAPNDYAVRRLLTDVFGAFHAKVWCGAQEDAGLQPVTVEAGITRNYIRAVAKVGFHYYVSLATDCSGAEDQFAPIRAFVLRGEGDPNVFVELNSEFFIPEIADGYVPPQTSHFFLCDEDREEVLVRIQFFVGPHSLYPPATVRIGAFPRKAVARRLTCHRVTYYDRRVDGFDGEIEPLAVVWRPMV